MSNMILDNYPLIGGPNAGGITIDHITPTVKIINNVIAGNEFEGVEGSNFHKIILLNNTLVNNGNMGIEMFSWPDPPGYAFTATVTNNIIMGHTECGITGFNEVTILVNFNDFWSNATDFCTPANVSKNISADPQFIDPSKDDYHISYGSPAMNVGTNQAAPLSDLDGINRPQMKIVDMGAFEVIGYILNLPLVTK